MTPLSRLFLRAMARTGGRAGLWAWLLLAAGSLAQALSVIRIPTAHCALLVLAGAVCSTATLMVEVTMIAGPAAALAELRGDGTWLGLRSLGTRGRDLVLPVTVWAGGLGLLALAGSHALEPAARGWLRDARVEAAVGLRLDAGGSAAIGPWALAGLPGGRVRFAGDTDGHEVVGGAQTVSLAPARGAVTVKLGEGEAHSVEPGWTLHFSTLTTVLPLSGGPRVETAERGTPELLDRPLNPYERWILWKRTLLPAILVPLSLLGPPIGARMRAGGGVGALALGFWTLLRISDAIAQAGPGVAATALLLPCLGGLALGWATWRDR